MLCFTSHAQLLHTLSGVSTQALRNTTANRQLNFALVINAVLCASGGFSDDHAQQDKTKFSHIFIYIQYDCVLGVKNWTLLNSFT